jgi:hypothetical protein
MRWLALLGMAFALVAAGCGGGDEEVVTSFGNFPTGDYCGTLLTARVFISAAFLDAGKVSQEARPSTNWCAMLQRRSEPT